MERLYSNSRIDRCGDFLALRKPVLWPSGDREIDAAIDTEFDILSAWRSLHAYPLEVVSRQLKKRTKTIDDSAVFAERLKRYPSIRYKLRRERSMELTTMQDIAGCRAVVSTIQQVYQLKRKYDEYARRHPNIGPELVARWTKDYIRFPKDDGYRSIHVVLKYRSDDPKRKQFNGLRIEIQIRSRLQHAWATAVETASSVTNQALKSGRGEDNWKRFFRLMGDFIAMQEECPLLATNAENELTLKAEASELATRLRVIPLLEGMRHVIENFQGSGSDDYYLLILDSRNRTVRTKGFRESDFPVATAAYSQEERVNKDNDDVHVVLVRVASIGELKKAYPSYFLDSTNFVIQVKQMFSQGQTVS